MKITASGHEPLAESLERRAPEPGGAATTREAPGRIRSPQRAGEEKAGLRLLMESGLVGVFTWHADGRISSANAEFLRMVGREPHDLDSGRLRWNEPASPERRAAEAGPWREHAAAGPGAPLAWEFARPDGTRVPVTLALASLDERGEEGAAIALDLSARRALEERLGLAQRLESVGRLVAGVAHDFNNVLTAIGGFTELALRNLDDRATVSHHLAETLKQVRKASTLTRQLLTFGHGRRPEPRALDLGTLLPEIESMLGRLIGEDVRLRLAIAPRHGRVRADAAQIEQIVMNLTLNARDAMPHGGQLTFELADLMVEESRAGSEAEPPPGRYVALAVSDTGVGMDEVTRRRIFEPFFTTKEKSQGVGLGLTMVHEAVTRMGGFIRVESRAGAGTRFEILLPAVEAAPAVPRPQRPAAPASTDADRLGRAPTLLLAEDDEVLRDLMERVLRERGYRVLVAEDGESALRLAEAHEGTIDLLVTDVVMPNLSGRALAGKLSASRPEMGVLYVSGYVEPVATRAGEARDEPDLLTKPFTADSFAMRVHRALERARPRSASAPS